MSKPGKRAGTFGSDCVPGHWASLLGLVHKWSSKQNEQKPASWPWGSWHIQADVENKAGHEVKSIQTENQHIESLTSYSGAFVFSGSSFSGVLLTLAFGERNLLHWRWLLVKKRREPLLEASFWFWRYLCEKSRVYQRYFSRTASDCSSHAGDLRCSS